MDSRYTRIIREIDLLRGRAETVLSTSTKQFVVMESGSLVGVRTTWLSDDARNLFESLIRRIVELSDWIANEKRTDERRRRSEQVDHY